MTEEQRARRIRGLLNERRGYELRGMKDRVAMVDEELRHLGHDAKPPAKRAEKRSTR